MRASRPLTAPCTPTTRESRCAYTLSPPQPFFSEAYLPDQNGTHTDVIDFRKTLATATNKRPPTYYCARYTTNGHHIVQRCNPNPARNSGVVRGMMSEMVEHLKNPKVCACPCLPLYLKGYLLCTSRYQMSLSEVT